jgi:hypothetical protein
MKERMAEMVPQASHKDHTTTANTDVDVLLSLPILWPLQRRTDELMKRFNSISTESNDALISLSEWVLRELTTIVQADHDGPSRSKNIAKAVEYNIQQTGGFSAQITISYEEENLSAEPSTWPDVRLGMHDIGIPEPCTDILHLLIDDLLHMSERSVERYHRVWCSSGAAMLVSSTTTRSFNTTGHLLQVSHHVSGHLHDIHPHDGMAFAG